MLEKKPRLKKAVEIFLVILIFFCVRLVMVSTGIMFVWIPYLDDFATFLLSPFTPAAYEELRIWLRYHYYSFGL